MNCSPEGSTIKVATGVKNEACHRICPAASIREEIKHPLRPGVDLRRWLPQLKNQSRPVWWPKGCCAVEVATSVENDARGGIRGILSIKLKKYLLRPLA